MNNFNETTNYEMNNFVELSNDELQATDGGIIGLIIGAVGAYAGVGYLCYAIGYSKGRTDAYHDEYRR